MRRQALCQHGDLFAQQVRARVLPQQHVVAFRFCNHNFRHVDEENSPFRLDRDAWRRLCQRLQVRKNLR
jgi:hypothetical protein